MRNSGRITDSARGTTGRRRGCQCELRARCCGSMGSRRVADELLRARRGESRPATGNGTSDRTSPAEATTKPPPLSAKARVQTTMSLGFVPATIRLCESWATEEPMAPSWRNVKPPTKPSPTLPVCRCRSMLAIKATSLVEEVECPKVIGASHALTLDPIDELAWDNAKLKPGRSIVPNAGGTIAPIRERCVPNSQPGTAAYSARPGRPRPGRRACRP